MKKILLSVILVYSFGILAAQLPPKNQELTQREIIELDRKLNSIIFNVPDNLANKAFVSERFLTITVSDRDGDGLTDAEEGLIGTSPNMVDTDSDGLPDGWEVGSVNGFDLKAMGASPLHKDIFVQMDFMQRTDATNGLGPNGAVIYGIEEAFANFPVKNPDNKPGINIHLKMSDKPIAYDDDLNPAVKDFIDIKTKQFDSKKEPIFHYMIWANAYNNTRSSGLSFDTPGSTFIVTLGRWNENAGGSDSEKIGTFIHELGHNLGLRHGGNDDVNFKPNYLSVMNYLFQVSGIKKENDIFFTYQPFDLPELDENVLSESNGLGIANQELNKYKTKFFDDNRKVHEISCKSPIDWNWNNFMNPNNYQQDLNGDFARSKLPGTPNDYSKLVFNGGSIGQLGPLAGVVENNNKNFKVPITPELTEELADLIRSQ